VALRNKLQNISIYVLFFLFSETFTFIGAAVKLTF